MPAGIVSQYGFLYQKYIFIKMVLDNIGMDKFFVYEGTEDIDIPEIERITPLSVSNITYIQVKSGNVSRDCWFRILGNFLLNNDNYSTYRVILEKALSFAIDDNDIIDEVCKYFEEGETKRSTSIANKVFRKCVEGKEKNFRKCVQQIIPKISSDVISFEELEKDILKSFKSVYCSDITMYEMAKECRCERFVECICSKIDEAIKKKKSYTLRYQDFVGIIQRSSSEISDQKYTIDVSEMRKRKKPEVERIMKTNDRRDVRQLRLVNPEGGFLALELVNELLYRDFRDVFLSDESTLISNIEEIAHSNYEYVVHSSLDGLKSNPYQIFKRTVDKEIPLSIVDNSPIYRHGCYVFLTSDEADEDKQISWG
ncbi:MAG: hypothetical protein IKE69_00925 [Thermoguttaceae bacterium]|nr:hypothetical protein [Thermoguttaceae bacterium]